MLEHVIVGGGIHGVHLAVRLIVEHGVRPAQVAIVDPEPRLLARWEVATRQCGMTHLRSPGVHRLDVDPWALFRFAGTSPRGDRPRELFAPPYDRPALSLFNAHNRALIARHGLDARHARARAARVLLDDAGVTIETDHAGALRAASAWLAVGASCHPRWPAWARALHAQGAPIRHVLDAARPIRDLPKPTRVAVIGAGITGAQSALGLAEAGHDVVLISRHDLREHQFDSDPGWVGPKNMRAFEAEPDLGRRRTLIRAARHRGSVPRQLRKVLDQAIRAGRIAWIRDEVHAAHTTRAGLSLHMAGTHIAAQRVLLATGYDDHRPGGALVDDLVARHALPCAACGYPIVDRGLRWHPRLRVSGPLAELELGPAARNIVGARRAGDRLVA